MTSSAVTASPATGPTWAPSPVQARLGPVECEILVMGGGSTGAGIARDAAMRGFSTVLVERADLATGTTGRFHGLLHSGGRYVVKDPKAAQECLAENVALRRIAADSIEDTGGMFVTTPIDDPGYADQFVQACIATGIPVEEIPVAEALRREPRLNPQISRALVVPDATVDCWQVVWSTVRSAAEHGARIFPYHEVVKVTRDGSRVTGALVRGPGGDEVQIRAEVVISATGAWAGRIAAMAGCKVNVLPGKGIMVAMSHRLVNTVVNRCESPSDGDILVPIHTVSVIGTTDVQVADPDDWSISHAEIDQMLEAGENLVPGFRAARALRVWGGVRPLFQDDLPAQSRDVTRAHAVLDHSDRDGVERFLTIVGGKFCTFRLMAQDAVDAACTVLGTQRPCRTADEPLPDSADGRFYWMGSRLARREASLHDDQLICECELIQRGRLEDAMVQRGTANLDDIRRILRLGMGPCQGGFCTFRATGILHQAMKLSASEANRAMLEFLQERWKGVQPLLHGDQLRQAWLDNWIFQGVLDVEHLPGMAQTREHAPV
ncbi:MAG TPA: anaerobic glycerol-3-phosphate dehydrogenase subunit GlpA [Streptosporangiaceae bacterium]|nr:anaerobic glycerol-3-phosphate dehydrogenase subunit GlpA [Streptosporangiaceae bacterium]